MTAILLADNEAGWYKAVPCVTAAAAAAAAAAEGTPNDTVATAYKVIGKHKGDKWQWLTDKP